MLHHAARDDPSGPTVLRLQVRLPGVVHGRLVEGLPRRPAWRILHPPAVRLDAELVPEEPELLPPCGTGSNRRPRPPSGPFRRVLDVGFAHGLRVRSGVMTRKAVRRACGSMVPARSNRRSAGGEVARAARRRPPAGTAPGTHRATPRDLRQPPKLSFVLEIVAAKPDPCRRASRIAWSGLRRTCMRFVSGSSISSRGHGTNRPPASRRGHGASLDQELDP